MTWTRRDGRASYNFIAPDIEEDEGKSIEVVFPTTDKKDVTLVSNAAEVNIRRNLTLLSLGSLTAAATLTLKADAGLTAGSRVVVTWESDDTARNITIKTDASTTACTLAGTISTKVTKEMIWNGATFLAL